MKSLKETALKYAARNKKFLFFAWRLYKVYYKIINAIRYGDPYFFRIVAIETCTHCNRKCFYCPVSQEKEVKKDFMTWEVFRKLIADLKGMRFSGTIMYHFYNEPLLDERLPEMVRYVSDQLPGCISRIFTNGDRLTMDMADALVDAGAFDFVVTDHPPNKPGRLRERMQPILDKYPSKFYVQGPDDMCLNNRGGSIEIVCSPSLGHCTMVYEELKIDYKGDVLLCTNDYHRTHVFGNIMEMGLRDIWKKPKYAEIRSKLRKGQPILKICKDCSVFKECDG